MNQAANPELRASEGSARSLTGQRLGRYEVLCELATGGMATVYIARAQGVAGFERLVALKVLHPHLAHEEEFISMFLDEARLAARIRHPNVVATQDISDSEGDGFFLVMDYVEGDHLGNLLGKASRKGARLPTPVVARLVVDALLGLGAAHTLVDEHGAPLHIVHRDISPHNVLVGTDGVARLTDFGVAKAEVRMSSTRAGQFKGKLSYMAPEQASTGECDQRSDLFAMGIVLWESLTARRLFRGESNAATLSRILVDPIPRPSDIAPELAPWDAVLARALARAPEERFQTADEFVQAIEDVATAHGGIATARAVGAMVREHVGPKVEAERAKVKGAITTQNLVAGTTHARIPLAPTPSRPSIPASMSSPSIPHVSSRPSIPFSPTHSGVVARQPPLAGESSQGAPVVVVQQTSPRMTMLLVIALVLVAGMAALAGYLANQGRGPSEHVVVRASPAQAAPRAETTDERPVVPAASNAQGAPAATTDAVVVPEVATGEATNERGATRRRGGRGSASTALVGASGQTTSGGASTNTSSAGSSSGGSTAAEPIPPNPYTSP